MSRESFSTFGRMRKWCWRVAPKVGVGLLVLFVLAAIPWTYFNIKWGRELESKLAELKAQGMPLTLADAAPKPVPHDQNAAVLYQEIFQVDFGSGQLPEQMAGLSPEQRKVFSAYLEQPYGELENQVRELLGRAEVEQALQTLRQGSHKPSCVFPVNWEDGPGVLFPHFPQFRKATYIIAAHALLLAKDGHLNEALDWCQVSLRMSEHVAAEPTLITQLVAIAMQAITFDAVEEILSERQLDPATATQFAEYLPRIDLKKNFTTGMIGERAVGIESIEAIRCGTYGRAELPILRAYGTSVAWPLWKLDELTYIDYMGRVAGAQRLAYSNAVAEIESANKELKALPFYRGVLAKILIPVFARAVHKRAAATANIGLCRVVLALKAYKYEHGAYPQSLGQLQETLDWQLPEDPFSGEDFVYQREGSGFKLYSIGLDLEDDGGIAPKEPPQNLDRDEADIVWECSR